MLIFANLELFLQNHLALGSKSGAGSPVDIEGSVEHGPLISHGVSFLFEISGANAQSSSDLAPLAYIQAERAVFGLV